MIKDPITGEQLNICECDEDTGEMFDTNLLQIIQSMKEHFNIDENEAIRRLVNSDAFARIVIGNKGYWAE